MNSNYKHITNFIKPKTIVAVIDLPTVTEVLSTIELLLQKNINVIELTLRQREVVIKVSKELQKNNFSSVTWGIGTIKNIADFNLAVDLGAQYLVSPGVNRDLLSHWHNYYKYTVAYLPGAVTASEIMLALNYDLNYLKFFPASNGIDTIKLLEGPFKEVKFCATGGINVTNKDLFLNLNNIFAIGISKSFDKL